MQNPFLSGQLHKLERQQQEEITINRGINYTAAGAHESAIEEAALLQKREILIQLTQWQQDRSEVMFNLFLKLCSYYFDKKEKRIKPIEWDTGRIDNEGKPILTREQGYVTIYGAQKIINWIETLDRNVMLGNWSEQNIIRTLRDAIAHPFADFLEMNHQELGLTVNHAEAVFWQVINTVEPTYWRGWNNGERRKDTEINKVNTIEHQGFPEPKKTFFGLGA